MVQPQEAGSVSPGLSLRLVEEANIGRRKKEQQDYHGHIYFPATPETAAACLFVVADGVSMGTAGALASKTAVEVLLQEFKRLYTVERHDPANALEMAFSKANYEVYLLAQERPGMATTCVAALVTGNQLVTAHVGDTRVYFERVTTGLLPVTTDHSWTEEVGRAMVQKGEMSADELARDNRRHAITRAMGLEPTIYPDFNAAQLEAGDVLVICTDGLWDMIGAEKFEEIVTGGTAQIRLFPPEMAQEKLTELSRRMVDEALAAGGRDNITLTLVLVDAVGEAVRMPGLDRLLQNTALDIEERINNPFALDEEDYITVTGGLPYQPMKPIIDVPAIDLPEGPVFSLSGDDNPPTNRPVENSLAKAQKTIALGNWEEGLDDLLDLERATPSLHGLFEFLNSFLVRYVSENTAAGAKGQTKVDALLKRLSESGIERYNASIFDECLMLSKQASQSRNYKLALDYVKVALRLRPNDNRARTQQELNELYLDLKNGDHSLADKLALAQRLYARDPDFGAINDDLATIYMELGDGAIKNNLEEEALAWYELIQPLRPSDTRLLSLAISKIRAIEDGRKRRGVDVRPQPVAATTPLKPEPVEPPRNESENVARLRERVSRAQKAWDGGRKEVGAEYINLVDQLNQLLNPNPWQPTFPRVCYDYGKWLLDQKQYREARGYFVKAQELGMAAAQQRLNEIDRLERETGENGRGPFFSTFPPPAATTPPPADTPATTAAPRRPPLPRQPMIEPSPLPDSQNFVGATHAGDGVLNNAFNEAATEAAPAVAATAKTTASSPFNDSFFQTATPPPPRPDKVEKPEKMVGVSGTLRNPAAAGDPLQYAASREAARLGSTPVPPGGGAVKAFGRGGLPQWLLPAVLGSIVIVGVIFVVMTLINRAGQATTTPVADSTVGAVSTTPTIAATNATSGGSQVTARIDGVKTADIQVFLAMTGEPTSAWRELTASSGSGWTLNGAAVNKLDPSKKYAVVVRPKSSDARKYRPDLPLDAPLQTIFSRTDLSFSPLNGLDVSLKIEPQALNFYPLAGGDADATLPNGARYVSATRHTIGGEFLKEYDKGGGLGRYGFPLSEEFDLEGVGRVQFFERAWLVQNPDDKLVKVGRVGSDSLGLTECKIIPKPPATVSTAKTQTDNAFSAYVKANPTIGNPISAAFEVSEGDSKRRVQYFEFGRLETNADGKPGTNLGLLGSEYARCKDWFRV